MAPETINDPAWQQAALVGTPRSAADESAAGFSAAAWLVIAQGGWWTTAEVLASVTTDMGISGGHRMLWHMANRFGTLAVRGTRFAREYAVTPACKIPQGLTVAQVQAALNGSP